MNFNFKHHILQMDRYQTSEGRDLERGLRLDRNEKVSTFSQEVLNDIFSSFSFSSIFIELSVELLSTVIISIFLYV